jgi:hypothetical protein
VQALSGKCEAMSSIPMQKKKKKKGKKRKNLGRVLHKQLSVRSWIRNMGKQMLDLRCSVHNFKGSIS